MAHLRFTILGCGSSAGVPRIGRRMLITSTCAPPECGFSASQAPQRRRNRASLSGVTASAPVPCAVERRVFTSMTRTTPRGSVATMSISPCLHRQLRATTVKPRSPR